MNSKRGSYLALLAKRKDIQEYHPEVKKELPSSDTFLKQKEQSKIRSFIKLMGSSPEQQREATKTIEQSGQRKRKRKSESLGSEKKLSFGQNSYKNTNLSMRGDNISRKEHSLSSFDTLGKMKKVNSEQLSWKKKLSQNQVAIKFPQISLVQQALQIG